MTENSAQLNRVLVVGTGLIGTSIAIGLVDSGVEVFLSDHNQQAIDVARDKSRGCAWNGEAVDLVVVATPPATVSGVIVGLLEQIPNAVITDVASVKSAIIHDLARLPIEQRSRVVGGHPMAGREVSGAAGAQERLFVDRPWVITAHSDNDEASVNLVVELATRLGAVPIFRTPEQHDRAVALVSHAPQIVSSVLASALIQADEHDVALAGQGIRDTIRIAGSDPALWTEILSGNAEQVSAVVEGVAASLTEFVTALRAGSTDDISALLTAGAHGKSRLPGKHGAAQGSDVTLTVRLADKPGELARLFAAAAQAQVNLEDVRIDHALGRMTGLVELTVAASSKALLVEALTSEGFEVVL